MQRANSTMDPLPIPRAEQLEMVGKNQLERVQIVLSHCRGGKFAVWLAKHHELFDEMNDQFIDSQGRSWVHTYMEEERRFWGSHVTLACIAHSGNGVGLTMKEVLEVVEKGNVEPLAERLGLGVALQAGNSYFDNAPPTNDGSEAYKNYMAALGPQHSVERYRRCYALALFIKLSAVLDPEHGGAAVRNYLGMS